MSRVGCIEDVTREKFFVLIGRERSEPGMMTRDIIELRGTDKAFRFVIE